MSKKKGTALKNAIIIVWNGGNGVEISDEITPIEIDPDHDVEIHINVFDQTKVFHLDGRDHISVKKPINYPDPIIGQEYRVRIPVTWSDISLCWKINYPSNAVWLAVPSSTGLVKIFCVSLISQDGNFFVSVEQTGEEQAYWDEIGKSAIFPRCDQAELKKKILTPLFEQWDQEKDGYLLVRPPNDGSVTHELMFPPQDDLAYGLAEKLDEYVSRNQSNPAGVLWYNISRGWGVALLPDGRLARIHWSNIHFPRDAFVYKIPNDDPLAEFYYLRPGDVIQYREAVDPIQTNRRKSGFDLELLGALFISAVD